MANDINVFTFSGRLGRDGRLSESGKMLSFSVANSGRAKSAEGNWEEVTLWADVKVLGERASKLAQYLVKGQQVTVTGRLELREWVGRDGEKRAGISVIASDIALMGGAPRQDNGTRQESRQSAGQHSERHFNPYESETDDGDDFPYDS